MVCKFNGSFVSVLLTCVGCLSGVVGGSVVFAQDVSSVVCADLQQSKLDELEQDFAKEYEKHLIVEKFANETKKDKCEKTTDSLMAFCGDFEGCKGGVRHLYSSESTTQVELSEEECKPDKTVHVKLFRSKENSAFSNCSKVVVVIENKDGQEVFSGPAAFKNFGDSYMKDMVFSLREFSEENFNKEFRNKLFEAYCEKFDAALELIVEGQVENGVKGPDRIDLNKFFNLDREQNLNCEQKEKFSFKFYAFDEQKENNRGSELAKAEIELELL